MVEYDPAAYGDAWSQDYDRLFESRDDPSLVVAALGRLSNGRSLLELGIGTGRLAIPLHDAGWHVEGVETSDSMVTELRRRAGDRTIAVHLDDMRTVRLADRFDVVLLAFSTLFLLPDQQSQVDCMANAADHLAPDGRFILEAFVPDHTRWTDGKRLALARWTTEGIEIEAARHDRASQTIQVRYFSLGTDQTRMRPLSLRYAWPAEIDLMARLAGMERVDRWSDWSGAPFDAASVSLVSVYGKVASDNG